MLSTRILQTQRVSPLRPVAARSHTLRRLSGARDRRGSADGAAQAADALRTPGQPLDPRPRADMERQFGYDFSSVRVHTDETAARASRAIGALAYTAGTDIAFDAGRYAPHSAAGRALLAHELAHVAQQSHARAESAPVVAPEGGAAEREADSVAAVVASGGRLAGPVSAAGAGTIQRVSAGGVLAGVGIGLGSLVGLAAAAVGLERLFRGSRGLNDHEKGEAQKVFGTSLNYGAVRLAESTLMTIGGDIARTPGNTVYFPPGTLEQLEAQEKTMPPADVGEYRRLMHWLIHETTHTWQTQHGVSMWTKLRTAMRGKGHGAVYDYKGPDGLRKALAAGQHFVDFNTEQQADICADYWLAKYDGGDISAYEPFIAEVRNGGMPVAPRPALTDAPTPNGKTMMA